MKKHIFILIVFIFLTCLLTYPLILHMHEAVQEPGDSLFVTWTIAWDIKSLLTDPLNIFNSNIFYPYKYTLAYSEHMIGVSLLALPIYLCVKNILFTYNFMLLLSFILCGWGAYLLIYYLTKNRIAGIVGGIIFAFCPFRLEQLGHLHVLTSQWIPFALIFLHKIIEKSSKKFLLNVCFGSLFYLQFISSGHNGLYLTLTILLFLLYYRKEAGICPWIVLFIAGLLLIPFYLPYIQLSKEFGFTRSIDEFKLYSPQLCSYIGVTSENLLYGRLLGKFGQPEAVMFPGIVAIFLVFYPVFKKFRLKNYKISFSGKTGVLNALMVLGVIFILFVCITGGIDLNKSICGIKLKVSDFTRPAYFLVILLCIKAWINRRIVKPKVKNIFNNVFLKKEPIKFYWILAVTAFLLSFGPNIRFMDKDIFWGPYNLLYSFFPGFSGLRVSGRIYTIFILAFSVLAGFGLKNIIQLSVWKKYFSFSIPVFLIIEYTCIPLPIECPIGTNPSLSYKWLAKQNGDFAIIELPMPQYYDMLPSEIRYMYWSTFHWKKMVNGYSGYSPPAYWPIAERMKYFPDEDTIEIIKYLGIKYVLVHEEVIGSWGFPDVVKKLDKYKDTFALRFIDGEDYIYELLDLKNSPLDEALRKPLTKENWSVSTNYNSKDIGAVIDNDPHTRWQTGISQKHGMSIEIDLGRTEKIKGVSMYFEKVSTDYPRNLEILVSKDKKGWRKVKTELIYANYVKHLLEYPKNNSMCIDFESEDAEYIKLIQSGDNERFFWSIYELEVYKP